MRAAEIMTPEPATLPLTASVAEAIDTLQTMNVRHLPIVDANGALVGMLSDRDLGPLMRTFIAEFETDRMAVPPEEQRIMDLMSTDPVAVDEDADIGEVVDVLVDERIGAVPVVDDGDHVVGIVSYVDVLVALRPEREGGPVRKRRMGQARGGARQR